MIKPISKIPLHQLLVIAMVLLFCYFLPYLVLGTNSPILIHDNLDSNFVWVKLALENGGIFAGPNTNIPQIIGGVPRSSVFATYDIGLVWFQLFGMFWGYVFNKMILSLVAFWGMFGLLSLYANKEGFDKYIIVGIALIYACLPFWSFTLSVAGMPAVMYAFLNLRKPNPSKINWLIISLIPWYSSLVLSGFFIAIVLVIIGIYDLFKNKQVNWTFFCGLFIFTAMYILSHLPLFYSFLVQTNLHSHRLEIKWPMNDWQKTQDLIISIFNNGQYHAHSLHDIIRYPIIIFTFISILLKKNVKLVISLLVFLIFTSILYGMLRYEGFSELIEKQMSIIPIQLQRFNFLHPMFWYWLFAIGLINISERWKWGKYLTLLLILIQLGHVVKRHEVFNQDDMPTFKQFFAENQFKVLKNAMSPEYSKHKVISVGLHPSISQYNGLYTLDGYLPSYPLDYKHKFRTIISGELNKDESLKTYFDDWGSRCYAFSSDIGLNFVNPNPEPIQQLNYNFEYFKRLNGMYLISTAEIWNNELELITASTTDNGYWNLYLYKVK